jgi:endonuclease YncB( thermonuclease family)
VIRVIDGDRIDVDIDGTREQVRYLGIDAPEARHPTLPPQPYGPEAEAANRRLVEGKTVRLEFDVQPRDGLGRLLAYVYVGDVMVNAELVRHGYAQIATFTPNVKYQERLRALQREAREAQRGLWGVKWTHGPCAPHASTTLAGVSRDTPEVSTRTRQRQVIANRLNAEGVPTLSGKGRWQKGTVGNLLAQGDQLHWPHGGWSKSFLTGAGPFH